MSEASLRPLRVLHIVSSDGIRGSTLQSLFMPLLTRLPQQRVKAQVVALSAQAVPSAVLRQAGIPVHDVALSRRRFSAIAIKDLLNAANLFRPDVLQAWGQTAQIAAYALRLRCDWRPRLLWSTAETAPLPAHAGLIDRQKLKLAVRFSHKADRIVYTSEAAAAAHRRATFPGGHEVIVPGADPLRFKPDLAVRAKVRGQLGLADDTFVVGMVAPFQPEFDHATLLQALGELIKTTPNLSVLLAGHGVRQGNAALMAMVGGGTLGARTMLLGEWSDTAALYNACDVIVSSALTDKLRINLIMAMLCGVPCVATGMGAQGEVLGQFGIVVEAGSSVALSRGITKVLELPADRRALMALRARKHALKNFVHVRSLQKYLQLYFDLVGREALATADVPAPEIDASIPEPAPERLAAAVTPSPPPPQVKEVRASDLSDPDSLELQARSFELPEHRWAAPRPEVLLPPKPEHEGDVLDSFEASLLGQDYSQGSAMSERARGVAADLGDLLAPELLHSDEPAPGPRRSAATVRTGGSGNAAPAESAAGKTEITRQATPLTPIPDSPAAMSRAIGSD